MELNMDWLRVIAAIILPPLGVAMQEGIGSDFLINLILFFMLPYFGGLVHALYIILRKND
jgi:uncharacterized membrane protein YqaE (UPF0057 family)